MEPHFKIAISKIDQKLNVDLPNERNMVEEGFFIRAKREETGVEYAGTYAFCCGVVPQKAVARYCDGKLFVIVPYRETSEAVNIEIQ